ncbi:unnamed protein product [Polarella glacialis]|uniref:Uncharacterized protein n=2 Tax=Polarella glacialis TaxID=89957 RepID=A0A813ISY7_POLGL|nr:unnamed protein product [Polarella glacialis]
MGSRACIWGRSGNDCFEVGEKPKEMAAASATPWGTRVLAAGCFHRQSMMPRQLAAWVVFLACCFCPVAEAALNLEQVIELAMLQLRERTFVADALLHRPSVSCDSAVDGPHCEHAGLAATRYELPGQSAPSGLSLVADGLFSDRLFSSSAGGELLDEFFLGAGLKEHRLLTASEAAARPAESRRRGGRARSALLTFRGLEPWRDSLPLDFAGTRRFGGGIPFRVRWEGPWQLVESPVVDNHVVRPGRFAVELRGSVGRLRFGRPVHVQSVDVSRPARVDCLARGLPSWKAAGSETSFQPKQPAEPPERPPPPLVIRGRKGGKVVFNEAIPSWEMLAFVNGVAFNAFTSTEMVDELVFLLGECALVGSVQVSFGEDEDDQEPAVKQQTQPRHHTKPKKQPLILAMRYGWKGYGWEEVEFRMPSSIANAPVWNLNEIAQQRLTLKPGIFDAVPRNPGDAPLPGKANTGAAELHTTGAGGEGLPLAVDGAGTADRIEPVEAALSWQRNSSLFADLALDLLQGTAAAAATHVYGGGDVNSVPDAELLRGLDRQAVNSDLVRLLSSLTAAEGGNPVVVAATSAGEVFDMTWQSLSLDALEDHLEQMLQQELGAEQQEEPVRQQELLGAAQDTLQPSPDMQGKQQFADGNAGPGAVSAAGEQSQDNVGNLKAWAALVPGATLTERLFDGIVGITDTIALRVQAKNQKIVLATAGIPNMLTSAIGKFEVRLDASGKDGLQVILKDENGHEVSSSLQMGQLEMANLLQALDPKDFQDAVFSELAGGGGAWNVEGDAFSMEVVMVDEEDDAQGNIGSNGAEGDDADDGHSFNNNNKKNSGVSEVEVSDGAS